MHLRGKSWLPASLRVCSYLHQFLATCRPEISESYTRQRRTHEDNVSLSFSLELFVPTKTRQIYRGTPESLDRRVTRTNTVNRFEGIGPKVVCDWLEEPWRTCLVEATNLGRNRLEFVNGCKTQLACAYACVRVRVCACARVCVCVRVWTSLRSPIVMKGHALSSPSFRSSLTGQVPSLKMFALWVLMCA